MLHLIEATRFPLNGELTEATMNHGNTVATMYMYQYKLVYENPEPWNHGYTDVCMYMYQYKLVLVP